MSLMPFQMAAYTKVSDFKRAEELGVRNCLSCGACSYVCPSSIPLVQYFMHAKGVISSNWQKERKSQQAKRLTEAKRERMEQEALAKLAQKQAKRPARASAKADTSAAAKTDATGASGKPARPARPGRPVRQSAAALSMDTKANEAKVQVKHTAQVKDNAQTKDTAKTEATSRPSRPARPARPARPVRQPVAKKETSLSEENQG